MGMMLEVDDEAFYKAMIADMKDAVSSFEQDLEAESPNIFFFGDDVKDKAMIRAHIDAFKLVISWYE